MGVTLDELLENSGISSLEEEEVEKTASDSDAQGSDDIVTALRKLASDEAGDQQEIRQAAARELAEKTAEIMVITKTIDEINKLASLGVQEQQMQKVATFIKVALDKGHTEEEIAKFLEKEAFIGRLQRAGAAAVQSMRRPAARAATAYTEKAYNAEVRLMRDKMLHGSQAEVTKHLRNVEGKLGKDTVKDIVQKLKDEGTDLPRAAMRYLPRTPRGGKKLVTVTAGGKEYSVGEGTAKAMGIGGLGLGTGVALSKKDSGGSGRGGTVILNR